MCYYQVFPILVNTFSFQSQAFSSCFTQYIQANSCSSVGGTVCLLSHQAQPLAGWVLLNPNYSCSPHILGLVARTQSKSWSGDRLPGERDLCITTQLGSGLGLPALNREVGCDCRLTKLRNLEGKRSAAFTQMSPSHLSESSTFPVLWPLQNRPALTDSCLLKFILSDY